MCIVEFTPNSKPLFGTSNQKLSKKGLIFWQNFNRVSFQIFQPGLKKKTDIPLHLVRVHSLSPVSHSRGKKKLTPMETILLMLQKSHSQPPFGYIPSPVNNGIFKTIFPSLQLVSWKNPDFWLKPSTSKPLVTTPLRLFDLTLQKLSIIFQGLVRSRCTQLKGLRNSVFWGFFCWSEINDSLR